jgi:hypothetical protein
MNFKREAKQIQRKLRTIPLDAIAAAIAQWEGNDGLWCIVDGEMEFVSPSGGRSETTWDDPLEHAQYVRWLQAHPERVHDTRESAVAFVRSKLTKSDKQ